MDRSLEGLCNSDYFYRWMEGRDYWEGTSRNHRKELVAWNHVSATQVENFNKCKRAWFFKSVLRIPEIQRGHQALGESFHLVMEKVPKGLDWPNPADTIATPEEWEKANALAKQALPLLPPELPNRPIKREHQISLDTYDGGPTFVGYIDLAIPPGIGWPAFLVPANEAIVGDYKTLSDFRYMKTPEELAQSVQMMSYGKWAIEPWPSGLIGEKDPTPEYIRLLHLYARTKGPFNRQSIRHESAVVTPAQINTFWDKTLDTVREMQHIASGCQKSDEVEANGALTGHCEAYGGCSFRDKCGLAKNSTISTLFQVGKKPPQKETQEDMSGSNIIAKIQAARAAQQGQVNPNTTQTQATQTVAANSPTGQGTTPPNGPVNPVDPVVPVHTPLKETETAKPAGPIYGLMKKVQAQGKGWPTLGGVLAKTYAKEIGITMSGDVIPGTKEMVNTRCDSLGELMKLASQIVPIAATGVVPPDAPPREQAVITQPGQTVPDPESTPGESTEDDEEGEGESTSVPENSGTSTPIMVTNNVEAPAKKRGRPSKEEMLAREAQAKIEFEARVEAEVAKRLGQQGIATVTVHDPIVAEKLRDQEKDINALKQELSQARKAYDDLNKIKPNLSIQDGCTLYVDCFPMKGESEITDFFTWIQPIAMAVAESNGVKDWRLIDYKGKGLLATHIRELVRAEGLPRAMTIQSYAGGADVALEILTPLAKRVIRKLG